MDELQCQVCNQSVKDDKVYCTRCGHPHHGRCWDFVGQCAVMGCGNRSCSVREQKLRPPVQKKVAPETQVNSSLENTQKTIMDLDGTEQSTGNRHLRLDLETELEQIFSLLALIAFVIGVAAALPKGGGPPLWSVLKIGWTVSLIFLGLRMLLDCTYVLDSATRELLYVRNLAGICTSWRVCSFDDIRFVRVITEISHYRGNKIISHSVFLELCNNQRVRVSNKTQKHMIAKKYCEQIAKQIERQALIGNPEDPSPPRAEGEVEMSETSVHVQAKAAGGPASSLISFFFYILLLSTIAVFWFN